MSKKDKFKIQQEIVVTTTTWGRQEGDTEDALRLLNVTEQVTEVYERGTE